MIRYIYIYRYKMYIWRWIPSFQKKKWWKINTKIWQVHSVHVRTWHRKTCSAMSMTLRKSAVTISRLGQVRPGYVWLQYMHPQLRLFWFAYFLQSCLWDPHVCCLQLQFGRRADLNSVPCIPTSLAKKKTRSIMVKRCLTMFHHVRPS